MSNYESEIIKTKPKEIPTEMNMVSIMEQFHWSYEDYMNTPEWVISLIIAKSNIDSKASESRNKMKKGFI